MNSNLNEYITVKDLQNIFKCSKNKAYKIVQLNGFPKIRIGKNYYINREHFIKWQKENLNTSIKL